jgi:hypothetical protein
MDNKQEVTIVDVRVPFLSLVTFFLKLAIAVLPAFIIFFVLANYIVFFLNHGF